MRRILIVTATPLFLATGGCTAVSIGSTVVGAAGTAVSLTATAVTVGVDAAVLGAKAGAAIIDKASEARAAESPGASAKAIEPARPANEDSTGPAMQADAGVELTPVAMPAVSIGEPSSNPGTD
jgi:hypothetical protein